VKTLDEALAEQDRLDKQAKAELWQQIQQRDPYLAELIVELQKVGGKLKKVEVIWM
jgi:hypothetical protein